MKSILIYLLVLVVGICIGRLSMELGSDEKVQSVAGQPTGSSSSTMGGAGIGLGMQGGDSADAPDLSQIDLTPNSEAPPSVADLLAKLGDSDRKGAEFSRILREAATTWAEVDPAGAIDWLFALESRGLSQARLALGDISKVWVATNPEEAFKYLEKGPSGTPGQKSYALSSVFVDWSKTDASTAWERYSSSQFMENDYEVRTEIIQSWTTQDPSAASQQISELVNSGTDDAHLGPMALRGLFRRQGSDDEIGPTADSIAQAKAWVDSLPAGSRTHTAATSSLLSSWVSTDPLGASQWLAAQPPSAARDAGVGSMINLVAHQDPEAAAIWSLELPARERGRSLQRVLGRWYRADPVGTEKFFAGKLSPADRQSLGETMERARQRANDRDEG